MAKEMTQERKKAMRGEQTSFAVAVRGAGPQILAGQDGSRERSAR